MGPENDFFKGSPLLGGGVFSTSHVIQLQQCNRREALELPQCCPHNSLHLVSPSWQNDHLSHKGANMVDMLPLWGGGPTQTAWWCILPNMCHKPDKFIHAFKKTPASIHPFQSSEKSINLWPCKLSNHIFGFLLGLEVSTCFNMPSSKRCDDQPWMALCFPYDILQLEFYRENLRPLPKSYFWSMASARVTAFEAIWRVKMANLWRNTVEEGILAVWSKSFWRTDLKLLLKTFLCCRPVTQCSSGKWRFIKDHGQNKCTIQN